MAVVIVLNIRSQIVAEVIISARFPVPASWANTGVLKERIIINKIIDEHAKEDLLLRNLINSSPGYPELTDPTPIAFDSKTFEWLNAKQLAERDKLIK